MVDILVDIKRHIWATIGGTIIAGLAIYLMVKLLTYLGQSLLITLMVIIFDFFLILAMVHLWIVVLPKLIASGQARLPKIQLRKRL